MQMRSVTAGDLHVGYYELGSQAGLPVLLLHGFPYDIHAYDAVAPALAAAGLRAVVPYLRGYGSTVFRSPDTLRSGEQAALGADLLALMDALALPPGIVAGYDWGGRAACVVSALWPGRVRGLVSCGGYNIQSIATADEPAAPEQEHRLWYQYYFHSRRGEAGLAADRRALCRLLWRLWSPTWAFDEAVFAQSAAAFDNPDFVAVVIHSYRHRFGLVPSEPATAPVQARLAAQPAITVPTIVLHGADDGVTPAAHSAAHARHFTGPYERRVVPGVGHNLPQESPESFVAAIRALAGDSAIVPG